MDAAVATLVAVLPDGARVILVGAAQGGATAAEIAATPDLTFVVDQVVTVPSPCSQVAAVPASTRVLSLEDQADPVAILASLINEGVPHRLTLVYDGDGATAKQGYVVGGRAADAAAHRGLRTELDRLTSLGYLAAG